MNNNRNTDMTFKKKSFCPGYTMIELLIVVSIVAMFIAIVATIDLRGSLWKGRDTKRKTDLNKLVRVMEDYYNDYGRYPPENISPDGKIAGAPWGSPFSTYVSQLPKDPLSPGREYYYQTDSTGKFFVLYAKLENTSDPDIARIGCQDGCGIDDSNKVYNYLVTSTNVKITDGVPVTN